MADKDLEQAMRQTQPAWMQDGLGARGPQTSSLSGPTAETVRRTDAPGGAIVRQPRAISSGTETKTDLPSVIDVYGAFNAAPAVFHLLQDSAPTSPPP